MFWTKRCVPPKSTYWRLNPHCDDIWEIKGFRWNNEGEALVIGQCQYKKRKRKKISLYHGKKMTICNQRALTKNPIMLVLSPRLPTSRNVRNKSLLFKPPSLSYFYYKSWNWLKQVDRVMFFKLLDKNLELSSKSKMLIIAQVPNNDSWLPHWLSHFLSFLLTLYQPHMPPCYSFCLPFNPLY